MGSANDHYFAKDPVTGVLTQHTGSLGDYEPTDEAARNAAEQAEAHRRKEEALQSAAAEIRNEARALEERQVEFEKRERDLAAREAKLAEMESGSPATVDGEDDAARRRLATDRVEE